MFQLSKTGQMTLYGDAHCLFEASGQRLWDGRATQFHTFDVRPQKIELIEGQKYVIKIMFRPEGGIKTQATELQ